MPERTSLVQAVQIGIPTSAGGSVTLGYRALQSVSIEPGVQMNRTPFRPIGHRFAGLVPPGKEWTQAPTRGPATYGELIYPLAGIFGSVAPSAAGTVAGSAYRYVWTPGNTSIITPQDFVVQQGTTSYAHQMNYAYWSEFGVTFNRDTIDHSGQMMAQRLVDNIGGNFATGGSVTSVELVPVLPEDVDVWIDATAAGLGTTQYNRIMSVEWRNSGFHGPIWTLDSRNDSWAAPVNMAPTTEMRVLMEADANGMPFLSDARVGNRKFLRIKATGGTAGTVQYAFQIDFSGEIQTVSPFRDEQGVYAIEYTFAAVYDTTWTKTQEITVINKVSTY